ncbi:MAPEG family protein [Tropicimonas aquimaris]|uniref:MAPEG family protein n=1 Tax=Tropicimonas aquimaris TaxID=914152 RepID=A0ABW3IRS2_9RHOB
MALLFVALSARVIRQRIAANVSIGDGADAALLQRVRVQANCAEYAPFGLLLLAMAELQGMPGWSVHVLGAMLFLGRVAHAVGLGSVPQIMQARQVGMVLTFVMLVLAALANIYLSIL